MSQQQKTSMPQLVIEFEDIGESRKKVAIDIPSDFAAAHFEGIYLGIMANLDDFRSTLASKLKFKDLLQIEAMLNSIVAIEYGLRELLSGNPHSHELKIAHEGLKKEFQKVKDSLGSSLSKREKNLIDKYFQFKKKKPPAPVGFSAGSQLSVDHESNKWQPIMPPREVKVGSGNAGILETMLAMSSSQASTTVATSLDFTEFLAYDAGPTHFPASSMPPSATMNRTATAEQSNKRKRDTIDLIEEKVTGKKSKDESFAAIFAKQAAANLAAQESIEEVSIAAVPSLFFSHTPTPTPPNPSIIFRTIVVTKNNMYSTSSSSTPDSSKTIEIQIEESSSKTPEILHYIINMPLSLYNPNFSRIIAPNSQSNLIKNRKDFETTIEKRALPIIADTLLNIHNFIFALDELHGSIDVSKRQEIEGVWKGLIIELKKRLSMLTPEKSGFSVQEISELRRQMDSSPFLLKMFDDLNEQGQPKAPRLI